MRTVSDGRLQVCEEMVARQFLVSQTRGMFFVDEIISTERLREIQSVDSDGTLLRELIDYFSEEVPRELEKTRRAVARQDKEVVRRSIHKLKSLFANVGAEEGARICAGCEQILANEFDSKAVLEALRRLEESYPLVLEELIQWTNFHP